MPAIQTLITTLPSELGISQLIPHAKTIPGKRPFPMAIGFPVVGLVMG